MQAEWGRVERNEQGKAGKIAASIAQTALRNARQVEKGRPTMIIQALLTRNSEADWSTPVARCQLNARIDRKKTPVRPTSETDPYDSTVLGLILTEDALLALEALMRNNNITRQDVIAKCKLAPGTVRSILRRKAADRDKIEQLSRCVGLGLRDTDIEVADSDMLPDRPDTLPHWISSLIPRDALVQEVLDGFHRGRLVTLTGIGGAGKTRLGAEAARASSVDVLAFPDGVCMVDLAPLTCSSNVWPAVLEALGLSQRSRSEPERAVCKHLHHKNLLLFVDNCEHLLDPVRAMLSTILKNCGSIHVLATSRVPINLLGEVVCPVPTLSVPDKDANHVLTVSDVLASEAGALFNERAHAADPSFAITDETALEVESICRRLDGIPLAIELVAARAARFGLSRIEQDLAGLFNRLSPAVPAGIERQQSMALTLDWSYFLLDEEQRRFFCTLAVFANGWTEEAAQAVYLQIESGTDVESQLDSLVEAQLISSQSRLHESYFMLEIVRQYAVARLKLDYPHEANQARELHRNWYLAFAQREGTQANGELFPESLEHLEGQRENLRLAIDYSLLGEQIGPALTFCATLTSFWSIRGHLDEGREYCDKALARAVNGAEALLVSRVLTSAGTLALGQGAISEARAYYERAVSAWREIGGRESLASALTLLGVVAMCEGRLDDSYSYNAEALDIREQEGDEAGVVVSKLNLGRIYAAQGRNQEALDLMESGLAVHRRQNNQRLAGWQLMYIANTLFNSGDFDVARVRLQESLAILGPIGDSDGIGWYYNTLARIVEYQKGDHAEALELIGLSLRESRQSGNREIASAAKEVVGMISNATGNYQAAAHMYCQYLAHVVDSGGVSALAQAIEGLTVAATGLGEDHEAARLAGASQQMRDDMGAPMTVVYQPRYFSALSNARLRFGDAAFDSAFAEGARLSREEAVNFAFSLAGRLDGPIGGPAQLDVNALIVELAGRFEGGSPPTES